MKPLPSCKRELSVSQSRALTEKKPHRYIQNGVARGRLQGLQRLPGDTSVIGWSAMGSKAERRVSLLRHLEADYLLPMLWTALHTSRAMIAGLSWKESRDGRSRY